ncbi:hypothetical protein MPLSOD_410067 [Mesorhizobium sp. SOD10]|nr:hypothetical protein MPLSOD_410067 [Mesorhizobium sp. SOD10]
MNITCSFIAEERSPCHVPLTGWDRAQDGISKKRALVFKFRGHEFFKEHNESSCFLSLRHA